MLFLLLHSEIYETRTVDAPFLSDQPITCQVIGNDCVTGGDIAIGTLDEFGNIVLEGMAAAVPEITPENGRRLTPGMLAQYRWVDGIVSEAAIAASVCSNISTVLCLCETRASLAFCCLQ